jgi:hypothetical protein
MNESVTNLTDLLKSFGLIGAIATTVAGVAYWLLQKRLEAFLAQRLELTKHEIQLEYQKKSTVFEQQKNSFRNVLIAMHRAIEAIRSGPGPEWYPISPETIYAFKGVVSEESLFMDEESSHALRLFERGMNKAVSVFGEDTDDESIRRADTYTSFISDRLSEHFRVLVGLATEYGSLDDVELLGACDLVNRYYFPKLDFPTKTVLALRPGETAAELVAIGRQNLELVRSELKRLKEALATDERRARSFVSFR